MILRLSLWALSKMVVSGSLELVDPAGNRHLIGDGTGRTVTMRVATWWTLVRIVLNPGLAGGESYMNGRVIVEQGDIHDLIDLMLRNQGWNNGYNRLHHWHYLLTMIFRRVMQFNPLRRSARNVAHHYNLTDTLYELFLDKDRQYSCAYFAHEGDSLDRAQLQKKRHIAAKLLLKPHHRVLDIGSGWGGLGLYLAQFGGADVLGVTLSEPQRQHAEARAAAAGMAQHARYRLRDYRLVEGQFDRVVSVGMFEHVGVSHYDEFFAKLGGLLTQDGVGLVHTIGRADGPGVTNAFIRRYIFPGGYSPALSEILPAIERAGLYVTDVEVLRLHYAETLRAWRRRLLTNRTRVLELYDERFFRMWEFYLAGSEATFRHGGHVVFQIQVAKRQDAVPLTRDYIAAAEAAYRERESRGMNLGVSAAE
jgi:cyclopropane-fatty-acyl-phospholipid synthase